MAGQEIALWISFGALVLGIVTTACTSAFLFGRMSERLSNHHQRLKALEESEKTDAGGATLMGNAVASLQTDVKHLLGDMEEMKKRFGWMGRIATAGEQAP